MSTADQIARHRAEFATLSDDQLLAITWEKAANPPMAIAAKEELEARKAKAEADRHKEALQAASTANHIAKWAIVIALVALVVSVIQTFWRV